MKSIKNAINTLKGTTNFCLVFCCLAVIIILCNGCNKGDENIDTTSGQVIDQTTGMGIPYAPLGILDNGGTITDTIPDQGNFKANANGFFNFTFTRGDMDINPCIIALARNYFNNYPVSVVGSGKTILLLCPKSYLNLHFITNSQNDTAIFSETIIQFKINNAVDYETYNDTVYKNKVLKIAINGNMMNHFSWTVKKNEVKQNFSDSIRINEFDSTNYTIPF